MDKTALLELIAELTTIVTAMDDTSTNYTHIIRIIKHAKLELAKLQ